MESDITLEVRQSSETPHGAVVPVDARSFQQALEALLQLLRAEAAEDVEWLISDLRVGSAVCGVAPDRESEAPLRLISNLRHVASGEGLPRGWSKRHIKLALNLSKARTRKPGVIISLASRRGGELAIDDHFANEVSSILEAKHHSLTSLVGTVDGWNLRSRTPSVGLTTDLGKHVTLSYGNEMTEQIRQLIGSRAEIRCRVGRNTFGDIVEAEILGCTQLPDRGTQNAPDFGRLRGVFAGPQFDPMDLNNWMQTRGDRG